MKKRTHLIFAVLLFLVLNKVFSLPLPFAVFAAIGALVPDIDLLTMLLHRKLFHNLWVLTAVVLAGMHFGLMDQSTAIAFSIGFLSHLIADAMTPMGVKPLWPLGLPHIKGPVKTGSAIEFAIAIGLLFAIGYVTGIVQIRPPF
ncbi:MAG: metal-dependent hydrolase [Candidatus Aenigmatarchaeota archaeon]